MALTLEDQRVAHDGMGEAVRRCLELFYANYTVVSYIDSEWLHHKMNILVGLFRRYGITANVSKSLTMTCQPGALMLEMSEEANDLKCTGLGDSYRVILRQLIPFLECGFELTAGSITAQLCCMHGTEPEID